MSRLCARRYSNLIVTAGLVLCIAACGDIQSARQEEPSNPAACLENDKDYLLDLAARYEAFEVHEELAGATPRIALARVIAQMGEQKVDLVAVRPAKGCTGAYTSLDSWMGSSIEVLTAFMTQESESLVFNLMLDASADKRLAAININSALEHIGQPATLTVPEDLENEISRDDVSRVLDAPEVEVVEESLGFRIQERNNVWWKFAYQFELQNNTSRQQSVNVDIKFLDADGYVVDDARAYDITIPPNGTTVHSDSTLIDTSEASSVVSIRVADLR